MIYNFAYLTAFNCCPTIPLLLVAVFSRMFIHVRVSVRWHHAYINQLPYHIISYHIITSGHFWCAVLHKSAVLNKFVQFYSLKCAVGNLANGPFAKLPTAHFSE